MAGLQYETITTDAELADLCQRLAQAPVIGFDTEFVSEDTYWSHLCLVQIATPDFLAVIDPLKIENINPFWEVLADEGHETICHAGREELLFSLHAVGKRPARLFDIQIAAGLVGHEYPAGYGTLVYKLTGRRPPKGETRTDWRRRPLTPQQIEYALSDVQHLLACRDKLHQRLEKLGRLHWMQEEMAAWQDEVEAYHTRKRWRRVSGISGLSRKNLAIVRELWHWREAEAQRRNRPPKRVLRDDLLVEMAKRATSDPKRILAIRGLEHSGLQRSVDELAACVERALQSPETEWPTTGRREMPSQLNLLGQFLSAALTSICHSAQVAPSIVGTASDVRDLIAYRQGFGGVNGDEPPSLARGWRAEVVGNLLEDLLEGRKSIRIHDPTSDEPLEFAPVSKAESSANQ